MLDAYYQTYTYCPNYHIQLAYQNNLSDFPDKLAKEKIILRVVTDKPVVFNLRPAEVAKQACGLAKNAYKPYIP